jgi:hypothetical protein
MQLLTDEFVPLLAVPVTAAMALVMFRSPVNSLAVNWRPVTCKAELEEQEIFDEINTRKQIVVKITLPIFTSILYGHS